MKIAEPTLKERADHLYRRLLILQRLFQAAPDMDDAEWLEAGDRTRNVELCAGIREVLDELTEHARVLTSVPSPLGEWRPGDGPNDERWRALTELERREVLALVSGYESLIAWGEGVARAKTSPEMRDAVDYLGAERARLDRFHQEFGFLERRRSVG
jgi:hypothetical protein